MHDLHVVPVGIEHKRCIIARVVRTLAWCAVIGAARCDRGAMKTIDRHAILRLKCQMYSPRDNSGGSGAFGGGDEELVGPEIPWSLAAERNPDRIEDGAVKASTALEITRDELEMIDQTPAV